MVQENCVSDCKFCIVHEYGVYAVSASGLLVFLLVIRIYWTEVIAFCSGKYKRRFPTVSNSREQVPNSPPMAPNYPQTNPVYSQPPSVIIAQPVVPYRLPAPPPPMDKPKSLPPGFNKRSFSKKLKRTRGLPTAPNYKTLNKPETPGPVSPDPFKLPTPDPRDVLADNESTGSNYYKQMMKGKRPVLSISQYLDKKHKPRDEPKKDRHNNTRRDRK